MIYEAQAISFMDSFAKPPRGRISVAAISAIILLFILMKGLPLSQDGGQFWTITGITIFSCAVIWSTLLVVMAISKAPSKLLGYAATAFFIIGVLATLLAVVLIAIAVLILYFGFKIIRFFMESDQDREAREAREEQEKIQEAKRREAAALAVKQREEEMLRPFGPGMRCRNCGNVVSKEADYCPECGGNPQEAARDFVSSTMDCRNCGHTVSKEASLCPECGGNPKEAARDFVSSTMDCRNCGHTVSKEASFCPECGGNPKEAARDFVSSTRECRNCGHTVSKEASFCPGCGGNPQVEARAFSHSTKECPTCGHNVNKDASRCPKCNAPVEASLLG